MKSLLPKPLQLSALHRGASEFWIPIDPPKSAKGRNVEIDEHGMAVVFNPKIETEQWIQCPFASIKVRDGKPFYAPGEVIAVKEKWAPSARSGRRQIMFAYDGRWGSTSETDAIFYPLGYVSGVTDKFVSDWQQREGHWVGRTYFDKFQRAATLPLWACRLHLTVTAVEARRVQSVTEEEAQKAGGWQYANCPFHKAPEKSFAHFFNSLHGPGSWEKDCWCWRVTFKRS